jgi:hypothetical protein
MLDCKKFSILAKNFNYAFIRKLFITGSLLSLNFYPNNDFRTHLNLCPFFNLEFKLNKKQIENFILNMFCRLCS